MKYSNIPNSVITKYAHILTGIAFVATSLLPLATPAIAQVGPTLNVSSMATTPIVVATGEVVYRIKVTNTTANTAHKVKVTSVLPTGFTYNRHITTLQNKAVTFGTTNATRFVDPAYTTKPVAGANTLVWDRITIPANGSIEFIFAATAPNTPSTTPYSMASLRVDSFGSASSMTPTTVTGSVSGSTDDVTLKPIPPMPTLAIDRTAIAPTPQICAVPGSQGLGVGLTGIVNTYYRPTLQSVATGTRTIAIAAGAAKGAVRNINPGDLVLIVQMQDASINNANSNLYGSGVDANQGSGHNGMGRSGLYEYAIADSTVSATTGNVTLTLKNPLINSYESAAATANSGQKRFQVVRVPQYASAQVLGTLFATPWDGNVGGILAVDTFGTFDLNGQRLSVNEAGFRGGYGPRNPYRAATTGFMAQTASTLGSGKGEGVAGTPRFLSTKLLDRGTPVDPIDGSPNWTGSFIDNGTTNGYPGGDTGRGAPANAGGGGNYHNAGGGGGGNGGNGGQGGLPWDEGSPSASKDAGGRPGSSVLTSIPTPLKVFMGGGGGGGEANDAPQGVPGGAGGGIVMLRAGTIVGTGTIFANGTNGDRGAYQSNPDGAGGGGAGGTVLIQSRNPSTATINILANGGNGGNTERDPFYNYTGSQTVPGSQPNANTSQTGSNGYNPDNYGYGQTPHGPGGGGSGGIVLYNVNGSTATINAQVNGGASGLTDDPSPDVNLRPRGGKAQHSHAATAGSAGQVVRFANSEDRFADLNAITACAANLTVNVSTSTPTAAPSETVNYTMRVSNSASGGGASQVRLSNLLPAGFTFTRTDSIVLNSGTTSATNSSPLNPVAGATNPVWGTFLIPPGATVEVNFTATVGSSVPNGVYRPKTDVVYPDPVRTSDTASATITKQYGYEQSESAADITVRRRAVPMVEKFSPTVRIVRK
ncbi:DUF11 domain-containing protein [Chamaesiphon minutus]|uniref:Conserved repeat protein n=1 Tax=Chamaesiphon minutus (strain ATCC 27169 / PCC 6605) TaxID=1173020 RepID=K9UF49_CHAP6|nr:DUF11 domain-containing protein [Chamaesiphon minutus]AFY93747.1 conserved repeat protein [Chamaesiphon minutus PCC 6605]